MSRQQWRRAAILLTLCGLAGGSVAGAGAEEASPPTTGSFRPTGALTEARGGHTATLLRDGRVLVVGGDALGDILASAELWDQGTGRFTETGRPGQARTWHTATALDDGRVLITGGVSGPQGQGDEFLASAELWDPATGRFTPTGPLSDGRVDHTATLLDDGRVLIAGGVTAGAVPLDSAELYDPIAGSFTGTGRLAAPRSAHTATLLRDGRVLVVGGMAATADGVDMRARAELWDPDTGGFVAEGELEEARFHHSATLLDDGRVLVVGGFLFPDTTLASAECWDHERGSTIVTGSLAAARQQHSATLLPDGRVLVIGGQMNQEGFSASEVWDPVTGEFLGAGSLADPRARHTGTLLPDGSVLVVGGYGDDQAVASSELWTPDA